MKKLFLRNIKKGFATNSSSYHSTIIRYIDIPKYVWVDFIRSGGTKVETNFGGFIKGTVLIDDEGDFWSSYEQMKDKSESSINVEDLGFKDGISWVRVKFEAATDEEY